MPRTTIIFRLSDKFVKTNHGPSPILTAEEESSLCKWITVCVKKGFPRRKENIISSVKELLDQVPRKNPFKNNTPGDGWFKAFLRRHPELLSRTSEGVTAASSSVSESDIKKWFTLISDYLTEEEYANVLHDPTRIFNGDETNFQLCPKGHKVIAPRGTRNVYEVDIGQAKSTLTVMFTFRADGEITPTMVIYPNKRRSPEILKSLPSDWGYGMSDNGWMKAHLFYEYIANVFHPYLKLTNTVFPVLLFVDGHSTHMTYALSTLCSELGIILIALYPNAIKILIL